MSVSSILSKARKILKSCFQSYFSTFNTFFSVIINVQDFFFAGERRCRVYPNAKHMVTLQTGSSGRYNGPDRWAPRPTVQTKAPWNAMKSKSQNKANFMATCRTISPSLCLCLRSFRSPPRVVIQEIHEDHGGMSQTFWNCLCRCKPGCILSFLRQESFHIQTHKLLLRILQYSPDREDGDPW